MTSRDPPSNCESATLRLCVIPALKPSSIFKFHPVPRPKDSDCTISGTFHESERYHVLGPSIFTQGLWHESGSALVRAPAALPHLHDHSYLTHTTEYWVLEVRIIPSVTSTFWMLPVLATTLRVESRISMCLCAVRRRPSVEAIQWIPLGYNCWTR